MMIGLHPYDPYNPWLKTLSRTFLQKVTEVTED